MTMSKQIIYTDAPPEIAEELERALPVRADFLPSPEEVARHLRKQRVTIMLDGASVDFFKREAKRHGVGYQTMIREVLGRYAAAHEAR